MTFKPNDTVILEMTVMHIENNEVSTMWTEKGELKIGKFPVDALKPKPESVSETKKFKNATPKQIERCHEILSYNPK